MTFDWVLFIYIYIQSVALLRSDELHLSIHQSTKEAEIKEREKERKVGIQLF